MKVISAQVPEAVFTASIFILSLSTLVLQTLAVMFRETEGEAARLELLSAEK